MFLLCCSFFVSVLAQLTDQLRLLYLCSYLFRFFWCGLYADVDKFVQCCVTCQKSDRQLKKTGILHPIPIQPEFWSRVGVDLIGPLEETAAGNKYILTCVDAFTKWPEAVALPDKSAKSVADALYRLFCRHGCCEVAINDQGREFVNQVSERLLECCGVDQRVSSAYHPQTNGLTERFNHCLVDMLRKLADSVDCWDSSLDPALFAYRTSVHDSTGFTPYKLVYGKEARLPIDMPARVGASEEDSFDENGDNFSPEAKEEGKEGLERKAQLAVIYGQEAESTHLDVVFEPAQQQVGSVDC